MGQFVLDHDVAYVSGYPSVRHLIKHIRAVTVNIGEKSAPVNLGRGVVAGHPEAPPLASLAVPLPTAWPPRPPLVLRRGASLTVPTHLEHRGVSIRACSA